MKDDKNIKIIGVGGGGANMIHKIHEESIEGVELIRMDTSHDSITVHTIGKGIELGEKSVKGYHTGGNPKLGTAAAEESIDEIISILSEADMVIIVCSLGGGVGSGVTPVIAKKARETGIYTVCVATLPFQFESSNRKENTAIGRDMIKDNSDLLILLDQNCLFNTIECANTLLEATRAADEIICKIVGCITKLELSNLADRHLVGDKVVENIRSFSLLKKYDIEIFRQDMGGAGCQHVIKCGC